MKLEHEELVVLARLLGHHVGGTGTDPLDQIAEKLFEYAERMGEEAPPLQIRVVKIAGHPNRVGISCTTLAPGI